MKALRDLITVRDVRSIVRLVFKVNGELQDGFHREDQLWDFKEDLPAPGRAGDIEWAKIATEVLAFHNQEGGVIFFGLRNSDFKFLGARTPLDTKHFNDKIRKYVGDRFWVSFSRECIKPDQRYLGVALIPPRSHSHQRMLKDGPELQGKPIFRAGDLCVRIADETRIFRGTEAIHFAATRGMGASAATYAVDEPGFRILRPDYKQFVERITVCREIEKAVLSPRTFVTSLTGIGGVGKTALACWTTLLMYDRKAFDFIVSVSARDRSLTSAGIAAVTPTLSSLEDLLDQICEVTGFTEHKTLPADDRIAKVQNEILSQFKGLLLVDNLETVDDPKLIEFLEELPIPSRAILTSRKAKIRVANYPIDVGPFTEPEARDFLLETCRATGKEFLTDLSEAEKKVIVAACDRIPLVIEWFVGRAKDPSKALQLAERLASEGKHGEELLEFSFRRVYEEMNERQKATLQVLSLINRPLPIEALAVGADLDVHTAADVVEELNEYSLIERVYDDSYRDLVYALLPITSSFIYKQLARMPGRESHIRQKLTDWYSARDIKDSVQRELVQMVRRGERNPELALLEVADNFLQNRDVDSAEQFYKQALDRNPRSWKCHRELAEFYRHHRHEMAMTLHHYQQAAEFAPKHGPDRALIFREWGMVLKQSGMPGAHREAAEKLQIALNEIPHSVICRHALGDCYVKMSAFERAIETLRPLEDHPTYETRQKTRPLLEECYRGTNRLMELTELRRKMTDDA